jgi:hypothetical protein
MIIESDLSGGFMVLKFFLLSFCTLCLTLGCQSLKRQSLNGVKEHATDSSQTLGDPRTHDQMTNGIALQGSSVIISGGQHWVFLASAKRLFNLGLADSPERLSGWIACEFRQDGTSHAPENATKECIIYKAGEGMNLDNTLSGEIVTLFSAGALFGSANKWIGSYHVDLTNDQTKIYNLRSGETSIAGRVVLEGALEEKTLQYFQSLPDIESPSRYFLATGRFSCRREQLGDSRNPGPVEFECILFSFREGVGLPQDDSALIIQELQIAYPKQDNPATYQGEIRSGKRNETINTELLIFRD